MSAGADCSLKSLTSPASRELLQSHNSLTFKLLKTVADFSQALATLHDRFGHELQMLVETFRKRNGELRKERPNCPNGLFQIWELFLQQVEVNSQQHGDISRDMSQSIGQGLVERLFHRKIQSKKVFAHKERIEAILVKSNELLGKCYEDYCQAYAMALTDPAQYLSEYIAAHNVYVHQLQATNGMVHAYQTKTLPRLLEELEECHLDTTSSISSSLLHSSELITEKSSEQAAGYQNLALACRQANHRQDLVQFVRVASATALSQSQGHAQQPPDGASEGRAPAEDKLIRYHQFQGPSLQHFDGPSTQFEPKNMQIVPTFKNEIAPDFSQPPDQQQPKLEQDRESLEEKIDKFEERIEALGKLLARSSESKLHNKVNELQEELCARKFDLYVAQIHLSAVRSQLQLFEYNFRPISSLVGAVDGAPTAGGDGDGAQLQADSQSRRSPQSGASLVSLAQAIGPAGAGSAAISAMPLGYRHKWIKAFKSLKETPGQPSASQYQQKFADMSVADLSGLSEQLISSAGQQQTGGAGQQAATGAQENQHFFQEYTFKKIASCDVCKDFLRGHMRQGVKCKLCKISCHNDCQAKAHGTIKCQQPKIKLLRRQKSAGELELNASSDHSDQSADPSERAASSKPDSIYSLIRQVLDAKKRGQHAHTSAQQQQQSDGGQQADHHLRPGAFANIQAMNLSTGNLALVNQNGKSVSASALLGSGPVRPEASVDRWSVVMELLAQSRRQKEGEGGAGGKRHSKQLDKFKLAARSVGKHQRYKAGEPQSHAHQQQQQSGEEQLYSQLSSTLQAAASSSSAAPSAQVAVADSLAPPYGPGQLARQQQRQLEQADNNMGGQTQQPLLIHHTKSLPVGQLAAGPASAAAGQMAPAFHEQQQQQYQNPAIGIMGPNAVATSTQVYDASEGSPSPDMSRMSSVRHLEPAVSNPIGQPQPHHLVPMSSGQYDQLLDLNLQQQQSQSTSAPHSPQRKRFNLRMKSFSLDSPESPVVVGVYGSAVSGVASQQQQQHQAANSTHLPYQQSHAHGHHQQLKSGQFDGSSSAEQMELTQQQQPRVTFHQPAEQSQQQQRHAYNLSVQAAANFNYYQSEPIGDSNYQASSSAQRMSAGQPAANLNTRSTGDSADGSARHQQQHRHSYHNQTSANYHWAGVALGDNNGASSGLDGLQFGVGGGGLMALAAGRQCVSQSSLNIHHTPPSSIGPNIHAKAVPSAAAGACQSSGQSVAPKQQTAGSLANSISSSGGSAGSISKNNASDANNTNAISGNSNKPRADDFQHHRQLHRHQQQQHRRRQDQDADYYDLDVDHQQHRHLQQQQQQLEQQKQPTGGLPATNTLVVLYDYVAQRTDEIQLTAGQLAQLLDTSERDWWKVRALDGTNRIGYFPSSYLAQLYHNERPLRVAQTIQVSDGESCNKLLRGQIVIHTGKQVDNFVTIRTIRPGTSPCDSAQALVSYVQCPEKYLLEVMDPR